MSKILENAYFIGLMICIFVLFHIFSFFLGDIKSVKSYRMIKDPDVISIKTLNNLLLVNIIVPAWKEDLVFKECLNSISQLSYPKLRVIVNAGGDEQTIKTANYYKDDRRYVILLQEGGADRPSLVKIKALNDCLLLVSEGIVYFIDADSTLNDEILLRMIYPIINLDEDMVAGGVRPLKAQENKNIVKYLVFDRFFKAKAFEFTRYSYNGPITGQSLCMKYSVIKSIGCFSTGKNYATDLSMGEDLFSKGYKLYQNMDYKSRIFVDYSSTFKDYMRQKTIWIENSIVFGIKRSKIALLKFLILWLFSLYILALPLLIFINYAFFIIGFFLFINYYLVKIRKLLLYTKTVRKQDRVRYKPSFFLFLIFIVFFEAIIVIRIPFHYVLFKKRLKKKNIKIN
ncbi:MAG: glycosyltransferase [Promethearchaeota archaeon]